MASFRPAEPTVDWGQWHTPGPKRARLAARAPRPDAEEPVVFGRAIEHWPERVAVVASGRYADYGTETVIMSDRGRPAGSGLRVAVASPTDLPRWACTNGVQISKYDCCCLCGG